MNIHVGNLARDVTEDQLREVFEPFGRVAVVRIVTDRHGRVSRGFAFVEMEDQDEGQAAIDGLNRGELAGRTLDVSEARPQREGRRSSRPGQGHGGGRSGGRRRRSF